MNSAVVAIDPVSTKGAAFERFCDIVRLFQDKGFFSRTSVASLIHASLYSIPLGWYSERKASLARDAQNAIHTACKGRFDFDSTRVLLADSSASEDLVARLSAYGHREEADVLVMASSDRALPPQLLGSFAGTAALTATLPVLIIHPRLRESRLSPGVRLVVAIDVAAPPSPKAIRWIARTAKVAKAQVDLVYAEPITRPLLASLRKRADKVEADRTLKKIRASLAASGVNARVRTLKSSASAAHAIAEFAEERKAWMIITIAAKRSMGRRLLLGSTARRILALTERPFLSLRME